MTSSESSIEEEVSPNIHDVARIAGVSTSTVSRSFRNPTKLSDKTRRHVNDVARKLNYRPRTEAAAAARKAELPLDPSNVIGFHFFSDSTLGPEMNAFYAPMLAAVQMEAERLGLSMLLGTSSRFTLSDRLPRMIGDKLVGGLLLVSTPDEPVLDAFRECVPHIVMLDNMDVTGKYTSIRSDGFRGTYEAVTYLFRLGHRQIGFVRCKGDSSLDDRFYGFVAAHVDAGHAFDERFVLNASAGRRVVEPAVKLLENPLRPTAIIGGNDAYALDVMDACRHLGLRVPDDLSVIGFDDIDSGRRSVPALTTMSVKKEQMGRLAVRRLLREMRGQSEDEMFPVEIRVGVDLVKRESCRRLDR